VEDKLVAGQERRRELESRVIELGGCKEQLEEELRKLESELENNEIEHKKLQNEHELKLKELHDKREELQHAQR